VVIGFLVPGRIDQLTGGYLFDRRVIEGMRARGRRVELHELAGAFPEADATALHATAAAFAGFSDGAAVAIDGLALCGMASCVDEAARRLCVVAFVHHPLALETGFSAAQLQGFAEHERRILRRLRGVITPSPDSADAVEAYGVPRGRIAIVPPGLNKPASPPPREQAGPFRWLCVATLIPRKGHLVLLDALGRVGDLDWTLTCYGSLERDPATANAVRDAASRFGNRIVFAGEKPPERMGEAYGPADGFVLASFHEGFGMAYAEAMAWGLPVIGTSAGAIPETVPEGAGLLVPPGDPDALATALRAVMTEPVLRRSLAAGAQRAAERWADWPTTAAHWEAEFDRLTREKR
jgi:glycosyltransferase involved in cell wall biosynthesis